MEPSLIVQFERRKIFNWNGGIQIGSSVSTTKPLLSLVSSKTSSLEWLANELNGAKLWKTLCERERNSMDLRLVMKDELMFPESWFLERSKARREVKFPKHEGTLPSKLLRLRSNSSRFLSLHMSAKTLK